MKYYWRPGYYDSSGNYIDECNLTEKEMVDFYELSKDEFICPAEMTLSEFIEWQGFYQCGKY